MLSTLNDFAYAGRTALQFHYAAGYPCNDKYSQHLLGVRDDLRRQMDEFIESFYPNRIGTWTTFSSGRPFWLLDPHEEDFCVEDIAESLSRLCRFNGHVKQTYCVGQHSYYVSLVVDPKYALYGLLHDASEAFFGDVITPLKNLIRDSYGPLEDKLMQVIAGKFGFEMNEEADAAVKFADNVMLATELRDVSKAAFINLFPPHPPATFIIDKFWSPELANKYFMERFTELTGGKYRD